MPLHVIAGPGCDSVGKDEYLEDELEEGDVVISAGRIFKSLTGEIGIPSENNPVALRLALKLRAVAIRTAREKRAKRLGLDVERQSGGPRKTAPDGGRR